MFRMQYYEFHPLTGPPCVNIEFGPVFAGKLTQNVRPIWVLNLCIVPVKIQFLPFHPQLQKIQHPIYNPDNSLIFRQIQIFLNMYFYAQLFCMHQNTGIFVKMAGIYI